ncbi:hypothetical protein [Alicyclobacillus acidoterrestris]|uniref:Uncharacterized protein n=1 Tax=Alicyclobacillus acidoterrestris (strain ATCC 49025 / DSM 3922 / CIP 106132 / NCIMB 13137 / GD3B) TaxID=1356854 RepID=A0A9E6ZEL0_ALIAG|nr:hypothetical protein [Alicyclobacillus acidoterrestris]UNO48075.1 hypothetical protein K1I37_15490 [Alicyclobacillus acidoterrestris]
MVGVSKLQMDILAPVPTGAVGLTLAINAKKPSSQQGRERILSRYHPGYSASTTYAFTLPSVVFVPDDYPIHRLTLSLVSR